MAVQYKNGSWGSVKDFDSAVEEFSTGVEAGTVRKLVVGTEEEVEEMIAESDVEARLDELTDRLMALEAENDKSPIVIPTTEEVDSYGR